MMVGFGRDHQYMLGLIMLIVSTFPGDELQMRIDRVAMLKGKRWSQEAR
jgi:hypothetical protein